MPQSRYQQIITSSAELLLLICGNSQRASAISCWSQLWACIDLTLSMWQALKPCCSAFVSCENTAPQFLQGTEVKSQGDLVSSLHLLMDFRSQKHIHSDISSTIETSKRSESCLWVMKLWLAIWWTACPSWISQLKNIIWRTKAFKSKDKYLSQTDVKIAEFTFLSEKFQWMHCR